VKGRAAGGLSALRRAISWHRRLLAAGLAAGAVGATITAVRPAPPDAVVVVAAARDLRGGAALQPRDLRTVRLPAHAVPAGALRPGDRALGRVLAAPLRRGEPLTDVRLVGPGLLPGYAGPGADVVAAPVRVADGATVRLLRVGDRVDVLAATGGFAGLDEAMAPGSPAAPVERARIVARSAPVIALPAGDDGDPVWGGATSAGDGALVVLAVPAPTAGDLAAAAATGQLSVTVRGP
jgi:pilus assembly protein CpaB